MKNATLVILAAGMGSRFGGLKQIEPVGPNEEFIIDYSVKDAKEAGFNKVVFIIKEENYELFKNTIGERVEPHLDVEYVFQKNDNVPDEYKEFKLREKPLGTAHAILCAKEKVNEPFAIINADDFYGKDAYIKAYEFLSEEKNNSKKQYGLIGYKVKNTLTENGAVKRGVCLVEDNKLLKLIESNVQKENDKIIAKPLNGNDPFEVDEEQTVSMNMLLFDPSIFEYIENKFPKFLENNKDNFEKSEFLIPDVLFDSIEENFSDVEVIPTTSSWYGVTYKEDLSSVKDAIKKMIEEKIYNKDLWEKVEI